MMLANQFSLKTVCWESVAFAWEKAEIPFGIPKLRLFDAVNVDVQTVSA